MTRSTTSSISKLLFIGALITGNLLISASAAAAGKAEEKISIPASSEAIWQSIDKESDWIAAAIQSGKLADVHHHAFAIRDLVAALPTHSPGLAADQLAKVKGSTKFVDTLAERLDATGDANDKPGTAANFEKLKGVLKSLRANYPPVASK